MNDLALNRGSDLKFTGVWRDEAGAALNLTGWTIAVFEPHPSAAGLVVAWTNAAAGVYEASLPWSDGTPNGRVVNFRLRISKDGEDVSSPMIYVRVQ